VPLPDLIDFPDVTVGGWTPTDAQWTAATAVTVGALAALLLMLAWRRTRKAVLALVISVTLLFLWIRFWR
jgi:hypothetical protein